MSAFATKGLKMTVLRRTSASGAPGSSAQHDGRDQRDQLRFEPTGIGRKDRRSPDLNHQQTEDDGEGSSHTQSEII